MQSIDPSTKAPEDIYKLMIGLIVPRPIAFVSTVDAQGRPNLAPFSYFTGCSTNPPVVCFCAAVRSGPRPQKDTLLNIEATEEFRGEHRLRGFRRKDERHLGRRAS